MSNNIRLMELEEPQLLEAKPRKSRAPNRAIKVAALLVLALAYAVYRFTFLLPHTDCINDAYHGFTITLNRDLVQEGGAAFEGNGNQLTVFGRAFIGMGQVLMDLWIAVMASIWLLKTRNLRVMAGIALFYLIRGVIFLNLMKFPYPANLAWRSPGFFSFTVPYDHTRDFFFSGHCGGLSVVTAEMFALRLGKTGALAVVSLLYMANMLLTTEVHYTIDILAGILVGLWFFRFGSKYTIYFDRLFSLPLVAWRRIVDCLADEEGDLQSSEPAQKEAQEREVAKEEQKEKAASNEGLADVTVKGEILCEQDEARSE